jgi:hypothetical protein
LNLIFLGIDDFLDHVTVLPPGEWDPNTRIEPPKSVPNKVRLMKYELKKIKDFIINIGRSA